MNWQGVWRRVVIFSGFLPQHAKCNWLAGSPVWTCGDFTMQRRILIVEDHEAGRQQLQKLLEVEQKIVVDTVNDGAKALEALSGQNYSIVITDLKMPRVDGNELIETI